MKNSISDPSKKVQISTKVILNNEVEISLGYESLDNIIQGLPYKYAEELAEFYELCACSTSADVREAVACKDDLPENIIHILVNDENVDVVKRIINDRESKKIITQVEIERLLSMNNKEIDAILADEFDEFINCEPELIISKMIVHPDPSVRKELAGNQNLPEEYRNKLINDIDLNVSLAAKGITY